MRHCAERHRADAGQRVSFPPVESDDESGERKTGPRPRIPSSAIACIAQYRSRYLTPEAVAMVKAMDADTAKETCLNVLKALGFIVTLRTPANPSRNRSWEMRRSAMRAKARAEKAALKMAQIHAEDTKLWKFKPILLCSTNIARRAAVWPSLLHNVLIILNVLGTQEHRPGFAGQPD